MCYTIYYLHLPFVAYIHGVCTLVLLCVHKHVLFTNIMQSLILSLFSLSFSHISLSRSSLSFSFSPSFFLSPSPLPLPPLPCYSRSYSPYSSRRRHHRRHHRSRSNSRSRSPLSNRKRHQGNRVSSSMKIMVVFLQCLWQVMALF